jgi:hypothetical protein
MVCCQPFENLLGNAGSAGFSVVATERGSRRFFCLQGRAVDESMMRRLGIEGSRAHLILMTEIGIRFCPFCGVSLEKWIQGAPEVFETLIKAHQRLT